jgi:hypothetical protein
MISGAGEEAIAVTSNDTLDVAATGLAPVSDGVLEGDKTTYPLFTLNNRPSILNLE